MDHDHTRVTPDRLPAAAAGIEAVTRDGGVRVPPVPVGGAGYGHDRAADAVAAFGRELQRVTTLLVGDAERAAAALRGGADAYLAQEQRALAGLMGIRTP